MFTAVIILKQLAAQMDHRSVAGRRKIDLARIVGVGNKLGNRLGRHRWID